ncbi:DUF2071 domain-containing protein [Rhodopirellula baltica]|uniref:Uncharacterized protein n=1 Tax=Rhodopirellula baltica SWK14 TaxID=993516 RepID=L7CMS1_RHOBT|nr:DUF2071 domain-containing protein [Rhodopirellula baltica]ELP34361.1 hypothetical protein RBSWK_01740 [Rhodopirellula baltica SWK14]
MKFLSAVWCDLLLANYEVDPHVLQRFVPAGTSLDNFEGRHYELRRDGVAFHVAGKR